MTRNPGVPFARETGEQRIVIHGVSWDRYLQVRDAIESPGVRMTFDRGTLEIMSPSKRHERIKATFARLVAIYALERGLELNDYGSTTFKDEVKDRGVEPDTCWNLRSVPDDEGAPPDIAFEVVVSKSAIDKLSVYKALGVREVWIWEDGGLTVHRLGDSGYEARPRSSFLPDLDLALITRLAELPSQLEAMRELRDQLRR